MQRERGHLAVRCSASKLEAHRSRRPDHVLAVDEEGEAGVEPGRPDGRGVAIAVRGEQVDVTRPRSRAAPPVNASNAPTKFSRG